MTGEPTPHRPVRILVCAFGPFPGVPVNPSARAARTLARRRRPALAGCDVAVDILPTRWDSLPGLDARIAAFAPDGVLLLGVAARRRTVCVETCAVNTARPVPDAARRHPQTRRLVAGAPARLGSTARLAPLHAAFRGFAVPARLSGDAGRYLCNASYFHALAASTPGTRPVVFIHLPGRDGRPAGVCAARMAGALSAVLAAVAAQARRGAR